MNAHVMMERPAESPSYSPMPDYMSISYRVSMHCLFRSMMPPSMPVFCAGNISKPSGTCVIKFKLPKVLALVIITFSKPSGAGIDSVAEINMSSKTYGVFE